MSLKKFKKILITNSKQFLLLTMQNVFYEFKNVFIIAKVPNFAAR